MKQLITKNVAADTRSCRSGGVNVSGYLRTESGVGTATRGYIRALRTLDIDIALQDLSELSVSRADDASLAEFDAEHPHDINLVCVDIEKHYAALSLIGDERFDTGYNIGVWWWELMRFPSKWYDRFAYYDEIWVGTSFVANSLAAVSPVPVVRIPPVLATGSYGSREAGRRRANLSDTEFVYLFIFDFVSTHRRKNPLAVIDAFKKAFHPSDPVRLIIKCVNEQVNQDALAELVARSEGYPVSFHTGFWTSAEVQDLIAGCDAYVSLHRAEGAGLTIAAAMAHGKPTIATGWSGNMDFMNVSNSFPVAYDLVELEENAGPYQAGEVWAQPSIEHASELMRHVFLHPDEALVQGEKAKRTIREDFSAEEVGQVIKLRLDAIATRRRLSAFREETKAALLQYRELVRHIRDTCRRLLPPEATVIVVSKGDNELLQLNGCRAWHFPQVVGGTYAGSYPPNSAAAVAQLEELRGRGGDFLLFPSTAFWWLDHYVEFKTHLARYAVIKKDGHCILFSLRAANARPVHASEDDMSTL